MLCISINYKKADADVRGKFAFDKDKREYLSDKLHELGAAENVILCTCSRTEIYACGNISENEILSLLSEASGMSGIKEYAMVFRENAAINHLFRVACGMDSMVMGEDEILGQTRESYKEAVKRNSADHELNMIFQYAIASAKKIKTNTSLSGVPVSTATLAANMAANSGENILMIGASGKIGLSTLKNLLSHKNVKVTVTARKHIPDAGEKFRDCYTIIPYEERYAYINDADCIISATSSPVYTLTYEKTLQSIFTQKPRAFIDLSVPKDIDEKISAIKNTTLFGIDHFEKLAENNSEKKLCAREQAEIIIAEDIEHLRKNLTMKKYLPLSGSVMTAYEKCGINGLIFKLKNELDADKFEAAMNVIIGLGKE